MLRIDFTSGDWQEFERELQKDLLDAYKTLANPATTREMTEQYRGRAAYIGKLLALKSLPRNGAE
jgi:hypothetical protein